MVDTNTDTHDAFIFEFKEGLGDNQRNHSPTSEIYDLIPEFFNYDEAKKQQLRDSLSGYHNDISKSPEVTASLDGGATISEKYETVEYTKSNITENNRFKGKKFYMNEFIYKGYKWKKIIDNEKTVYHLLVYNNSDIKYKDRIYYKSFDISYTYTYNPTVFFHMLDILYQYKTDNIEKFKEDYTKYNNKELILYKYNTHSNVINDILLKITNIN